VKFYPTPREDRCISGGVFTVPIADPLDSEAKRRAWSLYLPTGTAWYDTVWYDTVRYGTVSMFPISLASGPVNFA
jgi:hypothetical protein